MTISGPSTFKAIVPTTILDESGQVFLRINPAQEAFFNLPKGRFYASNPIENTGRLSTKKIAEARRVKRFPLKVYGLSYVDNLPGWGLIDHRRGEISLDKSLLKAPEYVRRFILKHELGHRFHKNEIQADKYAANEMLKEGFMPVHIIEASKRLRGQNDPLTLSLKKSLNL